SGKTLGEVLDWWEGSERRARFRELLRKLDGVEADDVILPPEKAREQGLTSTMIFPRGNLAPDGSVIKSTALDPSLVGADGIYFKEGRARVFVSEAAAMKAIKQKQIQPGDVLVLAGIGPMGTGMEETYQVTGALKYLPFGKEVALLTDARFSGVSTGACIGHIGPEGLAGGPIGKLLDGDLIRIVINRKENIGSVDFVGEGDRKVSPAEGAEILSRRASRKDLAPNPALPDDTRLWAALQSVGGGTWGGCVYDTERIVKLLLSHG
ncbi:MAG TPA: dihydroxy-acid dehydratase, partial [Verrucomicrobiae bacterium]|nr:dihydroxy-acid dehydratase [Verrucomicrobiae bacterium]